MTNKRKNKQQFGITEKVFKQLTNLLDQLGNSIELLYYLMNINQEKSFVAALISADEIDLEAMIMQQKRKTDILFEIDKKKNLYALLCQDTRLEGGYYFIKRLVETAQKEGGKNVYCSEVDVPNTHHPIHEIIFRLLNMYNRVKSEKADGKISFYSLT